MAFLGFPGIVFVSFHSTTGHRYAREIQMQALCTGKTYAASIQGNKSISVTIEMLPGILPQEFLT
jgi:hypothetical protein